MIAKTVLTTLVLGIREQALWPAIRRLHAECPQPIMLKVIGICEGMRVDVESLAISDAVRSDVPLATGEIRVRVQKRFDEHRYTFLAQALIAGFATGTGLSGFILRGSVVLKSSTPVVKLSGEVVNYNVHEWQQDVSIV